MPDSCDLPRAFLGRSQTAWNYALWGGMCWIDTNLFWPITELTIHSHWRGWEEQQKPSYMDVLDWPQVLFRGGEKCLHSSAFCHPIKQACFCLWITVRQTKNPHLKKQQQLYLVELLRDANLMSKWECVCGGLNLVLVWMKRCLRLLGDLLPIWEGANQVSTISQHSFAW